MYISMYSHIYSCVKRIVPEIHSSLVICHSERREESPLTHREILRGAQNDNRATSFPPCMPQRGVDVSIVHPVQGFSQVAKSRGTGDGSPLQAGYFTVMSISHQG